VTPGAGVNGTQQRSSTLTEGPNGVFCIANMLLAPAGTYTVTETAPPPGYDPPANASQTTGVSNMSTCSGVTASTTADLTFQDTPSIGAILVTKTAKDHRAQGGTAPLAGAVFRVLDSSNHQVGVD